MEIWHALSDTFDTNSDTCESENVCNP